MDGIMDVSSNANDSHPITSANISPVVTILTNGTNAENSAPRESNSTGLKKRVHFSTQNSMVQVPRTDCPSTYGTSSIVSTSTTAILSGNGNISALDTSTALSYATIYSNDYEPIGSENTSSNVYIDMESKLGQEDRTSIEKTKTPPALPPKPANLMKLRQVLKNLPPTMTKNSSAASAGQLDNESEPDYCSISEVQESVIKNVQIVADVHKNADDDLSSHHSDDARTDITDEAFADVPKLPNVAAIISPKKEPLNKYITQDNYIMKTTSPIKTIAPTHMPIAKPMPNILSEINGNTTITTTANAKKSPPKLLLTQKMSTIVENVKTQTIQQSTPIVKPDEKIMMPMQAEFDWYNLDAEYGKLIHNEGHGDSCLNGDELSNTNIGVEYNLDEEFALSSSSSAPSDSGGNENDSMIGENPKLNSTTLKFVPMLLGGGYDELTESLKPLNKHYLRSKHASLNNNSQTFDSFLEDTGLTAKPLPQKRKIFYSAPFV